MQVVIHRPTDRDGEVTVEELDAVVIGAGVAGLYQLHLLRAQGLRVRAYDAAEDVGGSWWWHGYPGSHLDSEGPGYQYLFSEELYRDWGWSERYPAGYEVQRWLRFVTDRLDLRRDLRLGTRIVDLHLDEERGRWTVRTDRGETLDTRFVVACTGLLPERTIDLIGGGFAGPVLDTAHWPEGRYDLTGQRVGVLGSGAAAVQLVPTIVDQVSRLTVFATRPVDLLPRANPVFGWRERDAYRSRFAALRDTVVHTLTGDEERAPVLGDGTRSAWTGALGAPGDAGEAVRAAMRARLSDPGLADVLVPRGVFGVRPVRLDSGYLEVFGRDDVDLVDLAHTPIDRLVPEGIELSDGTVHALDVIVLTSTFDGGPDALTRVDVRGRGGQVLAEEWGREARSTLGLAKHGYPNLFTTAAPLTPPSDRCLMTTCRQVQVEWIAQAIADLRAAGVGTLEATAAGEDAWIAHHHEVAGTMPVASSSDYAGGIGLYRERCLREAAAGYPSFRRA
ncbi:flavin-containing monooxygenase [Actinomycetospora callitridis]|uniref:flavin-containing monooxygenase n=1 Tax=Actinomycetospora callitridis TaxID=913944 RepID=UPI0023672AA8|nr:NAD(P)/FAD-dependent oxidoreductase [Actinomycetospora callitridis]MDD7916350.1 NAD(P)/FAD-dependent oxidoreductase [Actinomycetospora callitridis]